MLVVDNIDAGYRHVRVLEQVSLTVAAGEAVGVLGPNGAGKTTLLRAIAGTCSVHGGHIVFAGQPLERKPDYARAELGIAHVPEGRRIWPSLTVEENLLMGAWRLPLATRRREASRLIEHVVELFPRLRERLRARAAVLSGGEQQMLAIGRALMAKPALLLIDEPSIGLAPIMVEAVMAALQRLRQNQDLAVILVEQRIQEALDLCNRIYILSRGRMLDRDQPSEALSREAIEAAYFKD
jgi:branched-chain amino acid transport system ATP-binding protein